jgi:prefoldin subunit 5
MGNDRTLSKARKIAQRLASQIEKLSDALEDLELEFAMLMKTIDKMESKQGTSREVQIDVSVKVDEEDDNDFDVTNTSAPTVKGRRKF